MGDAATCIRKFAASSIEPLVLELQLAPRGFGGQIGFGRVSSNRCPTLHQQDASMELAGNFNSRKERQADKYERWECELELGRWFCWRCGFRSLFGGQRRIQL